MTEGEGAMPTHSDDRASVDVEVDVEDEGEGDGVGEAEPGGATRAQDAAP
jgi:hypothetical protein